LIVLINKLDFHINSSSFRISNDIEFDLFSNFPLLINLLNKAHDLNVHNNKIEHMINQLVSPIETTFPSMSINRLHLACELKHLLNKIPNKRLERHVDILLYSVEFDKLVNELVDNNMGFRRGVTGLIYILDKTNQIIAGNIVLKANVDNVFKQIHVPLINLSDEKVFSNPKSIGITEGYTAALLYNLLDRKII